MLAKSLNNEKLLLQKIAEGDEQAFTELFKHYAPLLQLNIHKIIGDSYGCAEVLQETFIKIWLNREKLTSIDNARAYFIRMTANQCFDYLNNIARRQQLYRKAELAQGTAIHPEDNYSYKETLAIVQAAIDEMPAKRKLIYQLSRNQGLNSTQIASQLNLNSDYVRQTIRAARKQIMEKLLLKGKLLFFILFFL